MTPERRAAIVAAGMEYGSTLPPLTQEQSEGVARIMARPSGARSVTIPVATQLTPAAIPLRRPRETRRAA